MSPSDIYRKLDKEFSEIHESARAYRAGHMLEQFIENESDENQEAILARIVSTIAINKNWDILEISDLLDNVQWRVVHEEF